MLSAVQIVRYSLPVVNLLYHEIYELGAQPGVTRTSGDVRFQRSLALENVRFGYPASDTAAVCGVSLEIAAGQTVGFIGESGSGKSTLVDLVLGLLSPTAGRILVDDVDIQHNLRRWQDKIGYVPQSVFLTDDTLRRNIAFGVPDAEIDDDAVWRAARLAQIDKFIRESPEGFSMQVGERGVRLSGGQLQRIGIARALYHDPDVLVLDEATAALDTRTERGVMDSVAALHGQKTIIIVAHRLSTVERCDRVFRLEAGRLVEAGEPSRVIAAVEERTK
jgi:ABC-type multidrug transport system fused ATPase/permease subunit